MVCLKKVVSRQEMEISVNGPSGANRLFIYTGIATFVLKGFHERWNADSLSFEVGRCFAASEFVNAVATASLASIANEGHAINAGWAVDGVNAQRSTESGRTKLTMDLAVRDSDGTLYNVAYEVKVLAKLDGACNTAAGARRSS